MREDKPEGPLVGVRVVEMTTNGAGPLAGQILADFGAEVVKIEPLYGDSTRLLPPFKNGHSGQFQHWNRNKKSVAVDLKTAEGLSLAKRLIAGADVFLENARSGVATSLGLGYDALEAENPKLIYMSINGFGNSGPYRQMGAFDPVIQALTGFLPIQGRNQEPEPIRNAVVDKIAGICGALSVIAALFARGQGDGRGQDINVNMLNTYAAFILPELMGPYTYPDVEPPRSVVDVHHMLRASDGYLLGLVQKSQLKAACQAFDRLDLLDDPRFATASLVLMNARDLMAEFSKVTASMTRAEIFAKVIEYSLPLAPVNTIEEFFEDPQVLHNKTYIDFEDPELGKMRMLNSFARFGRTPATIRTKSPALGENNDELLKNIGYSENDLARMREEKIIL